MASHFLLACLLIGCAADIPQDASDATCSHKDGHVCSASNVEYAEDDGATSFIQTQIRLAPVKDSPHAVSVEKPQAVSAEGSSGEPENDELLPEDLALVQDMLADDCAAKVARLDNLNGQELTSGTDDPMFPPESKSIAELGTDCGDSAHGISKPCEDYNTWKTFEEVATHLDRPYSIIGPSGVTFNDIQQGDLGNCYFLSALASIAYVNPTIIENMFVETWSQSSDIFKTKWLINGKESIIAVDNKIPAGNINGNTFFTHPSLTGEWWPVVLAKSWAKMFGSFKAIEYGNQDDVVSAITQSPSKRMQTDTMTDAAIWDVLVSNFNNKYPMYAATSAGAQYGLAKGHAYSILEPQNHPEYGQVVKIYNPWGSDNYAGSIPNNKAITKPGLFTIALSEFRGCFTSMSYNVVIPGYKVTRLNDLSPGVGEYDLTVNNQGKFWVSMLWPMQRFVPGCGQIDPTATLASQLTWEPGTPLGTRGLFLPGRGRLDYEFPAINYIGTYDLLVDLEFKASFLKTYTLSVYGPGDVTLAKSTKCVDSPDGLSPDFPGLACSQATNASPKWSNVKCTGAEYSDLVQKRCRNTCGSC